MLDWKLVKRVLFPEYPKLPNVREVEFEEILPDGLTMGTLYIGRQGTGKTSSLARHIVDYFTTYPDRAIFVLDWSGSISDSILSIILKKLGDLTDRIVYDELGHPNWVVPMPEFSTHYGSTSEEQAQRLSNNLMKLSPELIADAPFLAGLGLREIAPQIFRLLAFTTDKYGRSWQATEAKKLLSNPALLKRCLSLYGDRVPGAKWFFENVFMDLKTSEKELRTYAILSLLGAIETREAKARVGYHTPGWTPGEAIEKGLMVIVNGSRLINQKSTQHYLFTQAYSLIMEEINKRRPGNPDDKPVALVMDEVYSLISIPGMAEEVGSLSPLYRSRKLELYIVLQALSQLAPTLRQQIWSIGNIVSFAVSNFEEAYEIAQQLFPYEPKTIKMGPKSDAGQPIVEPDRGQYLQIANLVQRMKHRECVMRRYVSEKVLDDICWVKKTKDVLIEPTATILDDFKETLLKRRSVSVSEALDFINQRSLTTSEKLEPPTI